jgi:prepilin-type processing-associated H-X9-DG protein
MAEEKELPEQPTKPRTSKLAIAMVALGWIFILFLVLWLWCHGVCRPPSRVICGTNVKGLGSSFAVYMNDHDDVLPPADQWCDLLVLETDVSPNSLICPESDAIEGESTYAININVAGEKNTFPADVVLLFETDSGWDGDSRTMPITNRKFYSMFEESTIGRSQNNQVNPNRRPQNNRVYPRRWNLAGGPEMLTTRYHEGEGCNVLFVDGSAEWVPSNEMHKLRWTAEEKRP